jgi:endonuclease YncB( thermonuclease family)
MARKKSSYSEIVREISEIFEQGREGARESGNKHTLYANWKIGERIVTVEQQGKERAAHGEEIMKKLSADLNEKYGSGFSARNLANMRRFHRLYTLHQIDPRLTWTHYRTLIQVEDKKERLRLQKKAVREDLSHRALYELLKTDRSSNLKRPDGKIGTYRTIRKTDLSGHTALHFDLGFGVFADYLFEKLPEARKLEVFRVRQHGRAQEIDEGASNSDLYLYPAVVERVTDADTVILQADLGFGITARERFRLRGVNMPEKDTEAGRRAARKVEQKLKSAPLVVIRTYGTGVHGRYVVDILYLAGEKNPEQILKKGKFLNAELIRAGFGA